MVRARGDPVPAGAGQEATAGGGAAAELKGDVAGADVRGDIRRICPGANPGVRGVDPGDTQGVGADEVSGEAITVGGDEAGQGFNGGGTDDQT